MARMKTFLTYVILIIGFFALSLLLEHGLLNNMYAKISGNINGYYAGNNGKFNIEDMSAKACNINGYMNFKVVNTTGNYIEKCYLKLDLYNKQKLLADTEYIELSNMWPDDSKDFNIKFKANNIKRFEISIVETTPDKTNILNVLGWEIDLTNVFGLGIDLTNVFGVDLTNVSIFGKKVKDIFSIENARNLKTRAYGLWLMFLQFASGIPWWGYFGGWLFYVGLL